MNRKTPGLLPATPLPRQLPHSHPIHATFLEVFERLGGLERMLEWADTHYSDFMKIFSRIAPRPQPELQPGQVQVVMNSQLYPTPLDE